MPHTAILLSAGVSSGPAAYCAKVSTGANVLYIEAGVPCENGCVRSLEPLDEF